MSSLSPTEIGQIIGKSAREVNKLLESKGFQTKTLAVFPSLNHATSVAWLPTDLGKKFASESTGQWPGLRWDESIIEYLK